MWGNPLLNRVRVHDLVYKRFWIEFFDMFVAESKKHPEDAREALRLLDSVHQVMLGMIDSKDIVSDWRWRDSSTNVVQMAMFRVPRASVGTFVNMDVATLFHDMNPEEDERELKKAVSKFIEPYAVAGTQKGEGFFIKGPLSEVNPWRWLYIGYNDIPTENADWFNIFNYDGRRGFADWRLRYKLFATKTLLELFVTISTGTIRIEEHMAMREEPWTRNAVDVFETQAFITNYTLFEKVGRDMMRQIFKMLEMPIGHELLPREETAMRYALIKNRR